MNFRRFHAAGALAGLILSASVQAQASPPSASTPHSFKTCASIDTDAARLACYDKVAGRTPETSTDTPRPQAQPPSAHRNHASPVNPTQIVKATPPPSKTTGNNPHALTLLDKRWELSAASKLGTFNVRGYRPVYLLPFFYTTDVNNTPSSPSPDHTVTQSQGYQHLEAKFQLSLKTKVWQGIFGNRGDLWFDYTQISHWQVYNGAISRPFRETDYEPEAMLIFDTHYRLLGMNGHLLGIGIEHESNGQSNPLSRSWNRVVANIGFERGNWTLMLRPWWRIPEPASKDDNPNIEDYMGRGAVQIVHEVGRNEFSLMARHSFRSGSRSHGAVDFTWAFPIHTGLRGYLQIFNGYGESMIDYNHHATYVGLGVSLVGWY